MKSNSIGNKLFVQWVFNFIIKFNVHLYSVLVLVDRIMTATMFKSQNKNNILCPGR